MDSHYDFCRVLLNSCRQFCVLAMALVNSPEVGPTLAHYSAVWKCLRTVLLVTYRRWIEIQVSLATQRSACENLPHSIGGKAPCTYYRASQGSNAWIFRTVVCIYSNAGKGKNVLVRLATCSNKSLDYKIAQHFINFQNICLILNVSPNQGICDVVCGSLQLCVWQLH